MVIIYRNNNIFKIKMSSFLRLIKFLTVCDSEYEYNDLMNLEKMNSTDLLFLFSFLKGFVNLKIFL